MLVLLPLLLLLLLQLLMLLLLPGGRYRGERGAGVISL